MFFVILGYSEISISSMIFHIIMTQLTITEHEVSCVIHLKITLSLVPIILVFRRFLAIWSIVSCPQDRWTILTNTTSLRVRCLIGLPAYETFYRSPSLNLIHLHTPMLMRLFFLSINDFGNTHVVSIGNQPGIYNDRNSDEQRQPRSTYIWWASDIDNAVDETRVEPIDRWWNSLLHLESTWSSETLRLRSITKNLLCFSL